MHESFTAICFAIAILEWLRKHAIILHVGQCLPSEMKSIKNALSNKQKINKKTKS